MTLNKNADISIFLKKKEGKNTYSQISLEFAFTRRKTNTFVKILELHCKWKHKNHLWYVFNIKTVARAPLAYLTAFRWFS